ncbi:unnamed protein product [Clonostachys rosea]|uniref:DUF4185 domain-containing protein n=1 Tax=Bionectria ochroleuca TaxID=29856 RepID=A0ABY6TSF6_BIOOC|nr:unnamed protein product [Clonostachys rosea]
MVIFSKSLATITLASSACAAPASSLDNTQPAGENPIGEFSVEYLGNQDADNSCSHRDLGFAGHIQDKWYAVYGDTLWCAPGVSDQDADTDGQFHGMVRDSVSALTDNPLIVHDLFLNGDSPVPHQKQFIPFEKKWGEDNLVGFGGTSLVETDYTNATGAVYYLVNHAEDYRGAGVAKVQVLDGIPTVTERLGDNGYWWDAKENPKYGDVAAYRDIHSEYTYVLGNPPGKITSWPDNAYVYQARVKAVDSFDLSKYEYWWGRENGWKSDLLTTFTAETAVLWGTGQGQIVYSQYFKTYLYVHLQGATISLLSAPSPEGPWSAAKEIYTATPINDGLVYAGVAYPYLDDTGKTLTIAFTNNNHIQVIRVAFA